VHEDCEERDGVLLAGSVVVEYLCYQTAVLTNQHSLPVCLFRLLDSWLDYPCVMLALRWLVYCQSISTSAEMSMALSGISAGRPPFYLFFWNSPFHTK